MGVKKVSLRKKGTYAVYESQSKYNKNRKRDLAKHIKQNPTDECAKTALKNVEYRRKKPNTKGGWVDRKQEVYQGLTRAEAKLMAQIIKNAKKVSNEMAYSNPVNKKQPKQK